MKEENTSNKNHPGGMLAGISSHLSFPKSVIGNLNLVNHKAVGVPDTNLRVRQDNNTTQTPDKSFPGWNEAFTLIELLVVVLIIGILAAIALPQYQKAVMKTRYNGLKNLVEGVVKAEQVYKLAVGTFSEDLENLDINYSGCSINSAESNKCVYPWGYCEVTHAIREEEGVEKINVRCINNDIHMGYYTVLQGDELRRNCMSVGSDKEVDYPLQNATCMAETGRTTKSGAATNSEYSYVRYQY